MAKRADRNQPQIVKDLRKAGFSVQMLHEVGKGCPDILVGYWGMNWLFEIKDPEQPPSKRKLTSDEREFFKQWEGQAEIIHSAEEAIGLMEMYTDNVKLIGQPR